MRKPAAATPAAPNKKRGRYLADARIKILVTENPHRKGTNDAGKWKKVVAAKTVAGALKAGVDRGYLRYAVGRKLFAIA